MIASVNNFPTGLRAIRLKCLDCCCDDRAAVRFCSCHGRDGSKCVLWPLRFGRKPTSPFLQKSLGPSAAILLDPERMPPSSIPTDECTAWLKTELVRLGLVEPEHADQAQCQESSREF